MNETKKTIEYVNKTKQDAMRYLREAQEEVALWTMVVNECDADIAAISKERPMFGKARVCVMLVVVLVLAILLCTGCQTVKGAMGDTAWLIQKGADNIQTEGK